MRQQYYIQPRVEICIYSPWDVEISWIKIDRVWGGRLEMRVRYLGRTCHVEVYIRTQDLVCGISSISKWKLRGVTWREIPEGRAR